MRRALLIVLAVLGLAARAAEPSRDDLKSLRGQIDRLNRDIAESEEDREEVADELAQAERAISDARRRLRDISVQSAALERALARLDVERLAIEAQLADNRRRLGATLYRYYVEEARAGARGLLGSTNPNQLARQAYYLEKLSQARGTAIAAAREALAAQDALIAQTRERRSELLQLQAEQGTKEALLRTQQAQRSQALAQISARLQAQRKEVAVLRRDEARIAKLIRGLEEIARRREAEATRAAARAAQARAAEGETDTVPREAVRGRAESVAQPEPAAEFPSLRGRLRWPVKGELIGRFGATRAEGGATWKGVFIRASAGGEVRAVAAGKVAYADWLRGFGNLLIVDHGGGYMSIYGNNESLFKLPGETVAAGDAVASVGASGGGEESGLYFEIRHRGEPQDPLKWVAK